VRQAGAGTSLHVEAGPSTDFAPLVTSTAAVGLSVISDQTGVIAGTGANRALLRSNIQAAADHDAGLFSFSNSPFAPAAKLFHGADIASSVMPTAIAAGLFVYSTEPAGVTAQFEHGDDGVAIHAKGISFFDGDVFGTGSGLPASCRRITIPAGVSAFTITDAEAAADSIVFVSLNSLAGRAATPVVLSHVVPSDGKIRVNLTGPTVRPVPMSYIVFRACPTQDV
jgi:hypothetical protein